MDVEPRLQVGLGAESRDRSLAHGVAAAELGHGGGDAAGLTAAEAGGAHGLGAVGTAAEAGRAAETKETAETEEGGLAGSGHGEEGHDGDLHFCAWLVVG